MGTVASSTIRYSLTAEEEQKLILVQELLEQHPIYNNLPELTSALDGTLLIPKSGREYHEARSRPWIEDQRGKHQPCSSN